MSEQSVIVNFSYGSIDLGLLFELEDRLEAVLTDPTVGEYDGNEVAVDGSHGRLYMYGPDADLLFEVVRPVLEATDFLRGAEVTKRYGPPEEGVAENRVTIGTTTH